jgi:hypothetical protein
MSTSPMEMVAPTATISNLSTQTDFTASAIQRIASTLGQPLQKSQVNESDKAPPDLVDTARDFSEIEVVHFEIFELLPSEMEIISEEFHPNFVEQFSQADVSHQCGTVIADALGLPCQETHQQPYDAALMFPLSLSPDMYDTKDEFEVVVFLFFTWTCVIRKLARESSGDIDNLFKKIRSINITLTHFFGSNNRTIRRIEFEGSEDKRTWLQCTHGGYDLDSGVLTEEGREIATMREFASVGVSYENRP